jgi:hypothetical protein
MEAESMPPEIDTTKAQAFAGRLLIALNDAGRREGSAASLLPPKNSSLTRTVSPPSAGRRSRVGRPEGRPEVRRRRRSRKHPHRSPAP